MDADDQVMLTRVRGLARKKRLAVTTALVLTAGVVALGIRAQDDSGWESVEVSDDASPDDGGTAGITPARLTLSASTDRPAVGEEVVFTLVAQGGPVVTDHAFDPGVPPDTPMGVTAEGFECGYESHPSERTSTFRWTYGAPGEYVARGSAVVLDPCTGDARALESETRVVVEP